MLSLRLRVPQPVEDQALLAFLGRRAVPGVEEVTDGRYRCMVGDSVVDVALRGSDARLRVGLAEGADLARIVRGVRDLCDLETDAAAVGEALAGDPLLAPLVAARPGLRVPGAVDRFACAVRVVLGQQVSVAGATTLATRLVQRHGAPLAAADGRLTHRFPTPDVLADADLSGLGITGTRIRALRALARAVAGGALALDAQADRGEVVAGLRALPGFGPWTAGSIAMRALRDPDALPTGDLGLRRALAARGGDGTVAGLAARAERWRPWRAYAAMHLWTADAAPRSQAVSA